MPEAAQTERLRTGRNAVAQGSNMFSTFSIGLVAGLCASLFPRLMAALALGDGGEITLLSPGYLILSSVFSVLVGLVAMIFGGGRTPRETFVTALSIPAFLTGTANTTNAADALRKVAEQNSHLSTALSEQAGIPVLPQRRLESLSLRSPSGGEPENGSEKISWDIPLFSARSAYAGGAEIQPGTSATFNPAIQVREPQYVIRLDTEDQAEKAKERANELRTLTPNARAVKSGSEFLVIEGTQPRSRTDALVEALRLKRADANLQPSLIEVPR
jgi:hypothetical protein